MAAYDLLLTGRACKPGKLFFSAVLTALIFILAAGGIKAQGNLLITPKRLVFDGSRQSLDLNLANIGKDTAVYSISFLQERMKEDGSLEVISKADPGQMFADRFIRYFPKSVKLGPGESQVVKVQRIASGEIAEGEYRSHFYFRAEQKEVPLGNEEIRDTTTFSVKLTPVFGITIPVIIRSGNTRVTAKLSDLSLEYTGDSMPRLKMKFNRSGNISVYGDLVVNHISSQGKVTRVGVANGIAVYTPNLVRNFAVNLTPPEGVNLRSGKIRVTYSAPTDVKPEKYAEAELVLR
jgi:P pilus assembly chaperone PapD